MIKKYVLLRLKQTKLIREKIKSESDKFDKSIIETNQEIENIIESIVN